MAGRDVLGCVVMVCRGPGQDGPGQGGPGQGGPGQGAPGQHVRMEQGRV